MGNITFHARDKGDPLITLRLVIQQRWTREEELQRPWAERRAWLLTRERRRPCRRWTRQPHERWLGLQKQLLPVSGIGCTLHPWWTRKLKVMNTVWWKQAPPDGKVDKWWTKGKNIRPSSLLARFVDDGTENLTSAWWLMLRRNSICDVVLFEERFYSLALHRIMTCSM